MTTLEQLQQKIRDLAAPYRSTPGVQNGVNIACDVITEIRRVAGELPGGGAVVPSSEIAKLQDQINGLNQMLNNSARILQAIKDALAREDDPTMEQLPGLVAGVMRELAHYKDEVSKVADLKIELARVKQELALLQELGRNSSPPF